MSEESPSPSATHTGVSRQIPKGIWALGLVSLFMDISSEMIHALLPVYLVTALGASALAVGVLEGVAEATASVTKVFSGALSDWLGRRKVLAVTGYGLAALVKPLFPLANSVGLVFVARFVDRIGKGIRGAPRDALIADLSPPEMRGASFGLRQSLDTVGAFLGPLLAIGLMWLTADQYKTVFWIASIPAFFAVMVLLVAVKEPAHAVTQRKVKMPLRRSELRYLGPNYWWIVVIATVFTLARFSEAFLVLKAQDSGLAVMFIPLVLVIMSFTYSLSAYPVGVLADRTDRPTLLAIGLILLVIADLVLARSSGLVGVGLGVALWGLHMGFTQGLLATLVAETAPAELRGTAFGMFNLVTGLALLAASTIAGALWDMAGSANTFLAGAVFAIVALALVIIQRRRLRERGACD
ncbi:major facilitator superfamily protein [Marinobacter santoriniensis NKSG1]|uniref:Major facilitator superfamily protein n=1 Tax=Marinobacter santoriniensis NKSG1 TaxID=1288826 RepID=M7DC55_9GAMM|nr:MFS transporter [Marinobacter santoriniensis]EMP55257.1 major facilitator superfamily protein [Marinobacter santoriniensis NKSG1]